MEDDHRSSENGPLPDIVSSRKNSAKTDEPSLPFDSGTVENDDDATNVSPSGRPRNPNEETNEQSENTPDGDGSTATQGPVDDGDNDDTEEVNKNVDDDDENVSTARDCPRHCRDFWISACTGICCCCPAAGDAKAGGNWLDRKRQSVTCTDIPTLVIFLVFVLVSSIISIMGVIKGNPLRLYYGFDSFGNTCGVGNGSGIFDNRQIDGYHLSGLNMSTKKYVYFMNAMEPISSMKLCVEKCPENILLPCNSMICGIQDHANEHGVKLCRYDIDPKDYHKQKFGTTGPCPSWPVIASAPIMHRCMPEVGQTTIKKILQITADSITNSQLFQALSASVVGNSTALMLLFISAILMAFLIIVLIYIITTVVFWVLLSLAVLSMTAGTSVLWYQYDQYRNNNATELKLPIVEVVYASEKLFLAYGIVATALTVAFLVVIALSFRKIQVVIKVFNRAGKILITSPFLLFFPAVTMVFLFLFCLIWSVCLLSLVTAGDPHVNATSGFVYREANVALRGAWWFHGFCFLWFSQFILDCQNVVVSAVIVNYFFLRDNRCIVFPVTRSICTLLRHHLGSVAFGSLFITLWRIPKYLLRIVKIQLPELKEPFQMNRNGYAMVTIERDCFFNAANNAEALLLRKSMQVKAINSLGDFVLIVGKVLVTSCTTIAGFYWFKSDPQNGAFFVIPVIMTGVFSYFVAHSFMSVYESAVDTLLLCYCMDVDTSAADPIINDAVKELDDIDDGEKEKKKDEKGKENRDLLKEEEEEA